jgi:hypothetical protein
LPPSRGAERAGPAARQTVRVVNGGVRAPGSCAGRRSRRASGFGTRPSAPALSGCLVADASRAAIRMHSGFDGAASELPRLLGARRVRLRGRVPSAWKWRTEDAGPKMPFRSQGRIVARIAALAVAAAFLAHPVPVIPTYPLHMCECIAIRPSTCGYVEAIGPREMDMCARCVQERTISDCHFPSREHSRIVIPRAWGHREKPSYERRRTLTTGYLGN